MAARARVVVYAHDEGEARQAGHAAIKRMHELEAVMSDYRETSELARLMAASVGQPFAISDDLFRVLAQSQQLAELSGGAFDATIGPLSLLWRQARRDGKLPSDDELAEARGRVGWRLLTLDEATQTATLHAAGIRLDLGGIGKGFAVDEAMRELRRRGYAHVLVSLAGDIAVGEPPPNRDAWVVAIGTGTHERMLQLRNQAASTSGDLEQFVELGGLRYSHILDPRTGLGLVRHVAVT
ncbi:MAG TPA: FAD:protein FMN transferase, partial [Phycisphaerales bacterium]|nr:FAD:protein FMN transferase [Phycisphaerales bacterium]